MFRRLPPDQGQFGEEVSTVVKHALARAAGAGGPRAGLARDGTVLRPLLDNITDLSIAATPHALNDALARMMDAGIAPHVIADVYIPAAARQLGAGWVADTINFGAVTIGSARLQGALRRLGPAWQDQNVTHAACFGLVASVKGAQHTLGACVFAGQLRRQGMSVQLELAATPQRLRQVLEETHYNAVFLSASPSDSLENLSAMVQTIRQESRTMPVVIGGSALNFIPDLQDRTRADIATCDLEAALAFCDLNHLLLPSVSGAVVPSGLRGDAR